MSLNKNQSLKLICHQCEYIHIRIMLFPEKAGCRLELITLNSKDCIARLYFFPGDISLQYFKIKKSRFVVFVCLRVCHERVIFHWTSCATPKQQPAFQYDKIRPFILLQAKKAIVA